MDTADPSDEGKKNKKGKKNPREHPREDCDEDPDATVDRIAKEDPDMVRPVKRFVRAPPENPNATENGTATKDDPDMLRPPQRLVRATNTRRRRPVATTDPYMVFEVPDEVLTGQPVPAVILGPGGVSYSE